LFSFGVVKLMGEGAVRIT